MDPARQNLITASAAEPWATNAAGRAGYRTRVPTKNPFTFNPGLRPVRPPFEM